MTHYAQKFATANKFYEFDYLYFNDQFFINVTYKMLTEILKSTRFEYHKMVLEVSKIIIPKLKL